LIIPLITDHNQDKLSKNDACSNKLNNELLVTLIRQLIPHYLNPMLMLKLYELRIGNFFEIELSRYEKRIIKVSEITQDHVLIEGTWYHFNKLIPILVTEEILLSCGFEKFKWITEANVFTKDDFNCLLDENGVQVFNANLNNLKPLKYLHELQNLYADLTEKELTIELNEMIIRERRKSFVSERKFAMLSSNV